MRIAVLFHRFGPYHHTRLLSAVAAGAEVTGIEFSAETAEYAWDKVTEPGSYTRSTLFTDSDSRTADAEEFQDRLTRALESCRPQAVAIPGWSDRGAFAALSWCHRQGVPVVVMSESTAHDERRQWWKEQIKSQILGLCATALVGGRWHADYLVKLGLPRERIFFGYDVVDNDHFRSGTRPEAVPSTPATPYFLASARFIPKKNLATLLRAYARYRQLSSGRPAWPLVLLGDGPLKTELQQLVVELALGGHVTFPGFKQYGELPAYYARAGAFVHASTSEQWGLVVNEAVAAGLPVLVSERCGCVPELVREGQNGFTFKPDEVETFAARLNEIAGLSPEARARLSRCSLEVAASLPPARFGQGLMEAARLALRFGPPQSSRLGLLLARRLARQ